MSGMAALASLPVVALVTYVFAFPHYKFRSQLLFFLLIVAFTLLLFLTETTKGLVWACVGLGGVTVINVLRFTAPQV